MEFENLVPLRFTKFRQPLRGDEVIAPLGRMTDVWSPGDAKTLEARREQCHCYTCTTFGSCGSVTLRLSPRQSETSGEFTEDVRWCVAKRDVARPLARATPLHAALALGASEASIAALLKARPQDARCAASGMLPLHVALETPQTTATRLAVLAAFPGAAEASYADADPNHPVGGVALHAAVYQGADVFVVAALLRLFPQAATRVDRRGKFPVHVALKYRADDTVVAALIAASPECAGMPYPWPLDLPLTDRHCNAVAADDGRRPTALPVFDKKGASPVPSIGGAASGKDTSSSSNLVVVESSVGGDEESCGGSSSYDDDKEDKSSSSSSIDKKKTGGGRDDASNRRSSSLATLKNSSTSSSSSSKPPSKTQQLSSPTLLMAALLGRSANYGALRCAGKRGKVVARLLELRSPVLTILKAYPGASVALAEQTLMTPVHVAALVGAPVTVLQCLAKAAKAHGRVEPDANDNLPIHIALLRNAPPRVLQAILGASSSAAKVPKKQTRAPITKLLARSSPSYNL